MLSSEPNVDRLWTAMDFPSATRLLSRLLDEDEVNSEATGSFIIEGYVLGQELGRGGGGQVFSATREGGNERLAIKVLNRPTGRSTSDKRAWRELDLLSELHLPGVPAIHDYGITDNRIYFVTSHIEGLTLADHCQENNLDLRSRVVLLAKVAAVVEKLHEHGVIHRDIKPDNIIISPNGEPMIVDFGIASFLTSEPTETITTDGAPIGTVAFMSPEQARGERERTSTRSDVYSLGATACCVLTGKTPHNVKTSLHEAIRRVAQEQPRHPRLLDPTLPQPLGEIIARATAVDPQDRYASAAQFGEDFNRWLRDEPIEWQRPRMTTRLGLSWRRNRQAFLAKAAMFALLLMTFVMSSIAFAQWQVAQDAQEIQQQAVQLASDRADLVEEQTELADRWENEARERDEWRLIVEEEARKRRSILEKQISLIRKAMSQGELFDATLFLLHFAEQVQLLNPDEQTQLNLFVRLLNELLFEAASQQASQTDTPNNPSTSEEIP